MSGNIKSNNCISLQVSTAGELSLVLAAHIDKLVPFFILLTDSEQQADRLVRHHVTLAFAFTSLSGGEFELSVLDLPVSSCRVRIRRTKLLRPYRQ